MQPESDTKLSKAFEQIEAQNIRNVCIIAHVDHGKTTLADSLISSNGIISTRYAGKLRYMDSREDEQTRGITMKSSTVSLYHEPFLINLIDSPGHVDFGSEVNSAVNLADVAVLVVDVIEGVCSQTEALLRQSFLHQLDVVLVVNKLDRLIFEFKLTEAEAFRHIQRLIEHVNSCLAQIITGTFLENEEEDMAKMEEIEEKLHFDPAKGNVLFASAVHGFGFSLEDFANLYAHKLGIENKKELVDVLFGDYFLSGGKIRPEADAKGKKPLFEQLVLQPVWELYKVGLVDKDIDRLRTLAGKLNVPALTCKRLDEVFDELMRNWMPLTKAVLKACVRAKNARIAFADPERALLVVPSAEHTLFEPVKNCDKDCDLDVVFVAKLLKFQGKKIAMCRVMSGLLKAGKKLYAAGSSESEPFEVNQIFALLGRELVPIASAPAGVVCAIELNSWLPGSTLCSQPIAEPLSFTTRTLEPLVRVTIQSLGGPSEWDDLRDGLKQLTILDSAVRVLEQDNGDLALITAGEVHLQKCIQDLNDMGLVAISVSEPIVPFLETIIPDPGSSYARITATTITECFMRQFGLRLRLRAIPLHDNVVKFLQKHDAEMKGMRDLTASENSVSHFKHGLLEVAKASLPSMKGSIWTRKSAADIEAFVEKIWAFGPTRAKNNILVNGVSEYDRPSIWESKSSKRCWPLDRAIVAGFDLAMGAGPLCQEPLQGVCILIESWTMEPVEKSQSTPEDSEDETASNNGTVSVGDSLNLADVNDSQIHGQLISATKATVKAAIEKHPRRVVAAMYKCKVQTSSQALGKVHSVLAQRHAKVLNEDLNQMNGLFEIEAYMPVVESFSFCEQLRKKTSGMAAAQMEFSHWQLIEEDPFWEPTTEDEIEEFGIKGDSINQARLYVDMVRKRKGILEEMIVVNAEKQRNLKRNK